MKSGFFAFLAAAVCALGSACVSTEQIAAQQAYLTCDGFGNVLESGDGLTKLPSNWVIVAGSLTRTKLPYGEAGIASCNHAVAEIGQDFPQFWERKVSLLQSRALHQIAAEDMEGAFDSLNEADKVSEGRSDVFFERSIDLNTDIIRVFALSKIGQMDAAVELSDATLTKRPYAKSTALALLSALGHRAPEETVLALLSRTAVLMPTTSRSHFFYLFEQERYEEVLSIMDSVAAVKVPSDSGAPFSVRYTLQLVEPVAKARGFMRLQGRAAFATAALGREDEAREWLASMQSTYSSAIPKVGILPEKPTSRDREKRDIESRVHDAYVAGGSDLITFWTGLTQARLAVAAGDEEASLLHLTEAIKGMKTESTGAIDSLARASSAEESEAADLLSEVFSERRWAAANLPPAELNVLAPLLFDGETISRSGAALGISLSMVFDPDAASRGDCKEEVKQAGLEVVCFHGFEGTLAMNEEQALLRAAGIAKKRGKAGFVIEDRSDTRQSVVNTNFSVPISETDLGSEVRLTLRFVDTLSEDCRACLSADEILADLSPIYYPQAGEIRVQ